MIFFCCGQNLIAGSQARASPGKMGKDSRLTFRRRHSYNTTSNVTRAIKTPGGKLAVQYTKKRGTVAKCGDCKCNLRGVKALRPMSNKYVPKRCKRVSRVYGGARCGSCVRERIVRAFLIEEQKIVKRVLHDQQKKDKSK